MPLIFCPTLSWLGLWRGKEPSCTPPDRGGGVGWSLGLYDALAEAMDVAKKILAKAANVRHEARTKYLRGTFTSAFLRRATRLCLQGCRPSHIPIDPPYPHVHACTHRCSTWTCARPCVYVFVYVQACPRVHGSAGVRIWVSRQFAG